MTDEEQGWREIPDEPLPPIITLQVGEVFEATYLGHRPSPQFDNVLHDFEDNGEKLAVSGRPILTRKLEKVEPGSRVRIKRLTQGEQRNPAQFEVLVKAS